MTQAVPMIHIAELEMACNMCLVFKARVYLFSVDDIGRSNVTLNGLISAHCETVHNVYSVPRT